MTVRRTLLSSVAALGVLLGATAAVAQQSSAGGSVQVIGTDARSSLSAGFDDAGQAAMGLSLVSHTPHAPGFGTSETLFSPPKTAEERAALRASAEGDPSFSVLGTANSDMAMSNGRLFVGNFNGFNAYDVSGDAPRLVMSVVCPGGQGDVSVHGNLLFMSVEENRGRVDCSGGGNAEEVSAERFRGVRIFDISDLNAPRQIAAVQTCRGSHTHTQVPDPSDRNVLYIYGEGTADVRKTGELDICTDGQPDANPETALFSIDVIKVPLDHPENAALVNRPRIFADATTGRVAGLWRGGRSGIATQDTAQTNQCHDITVYPEIGLAGGACSGNGILLDITDPVNPRRTSDIFDPDMAYWHSATFNNAGDKVVFTDEWGGGIGARCQATDPATWGANMIATIADRTLTGRSFHKLPTAQGATENCVAHNGNIIPVPGRDLMVQSWYQGGVSIMDFTDPAHAVEIAYFDRGPISAERLYVGGSWSAYWFNGRIYSSEIARGLDVLKLLPSDQLSAAEIAAAEAIMAGEINPQTQTKIEWADSPDVAASYVDQLARTDAIEDGVEARVRTVIAGWRSGSADKAAAGDLATALATAPDGATDATKARMASLSALLQRLAA
ncbi:LVIVD repeat-containing protein [Brevundimonas sp.]|uniref:LVIVD repeat-containing protein n=1 Tax=Brevundimonas sp. TaxID=1871086 RepID=UPI003D0BA629